MILGFTGTQHGMTQRQQDTVRYLFHELPLHVLHHGVCVGADAEAHRIALRLSALIVGHSPTDAKKMAVLKGFDQLHEPQPYLRRNKSIVSHGRDGLIAAPFDDIEPRSLRGQGTWTTIGYARKAGRRVWIVHRDGTFRMEMPR